MAGAGVLEHIRAKDIESQISVFVDTTDEGVEKKVCADEKSKKLDADHCLVTKWRTAFFIGAGIAAAGSGISFWFSAAPKNSIANAQGPLLMLTAGGQF